MTSLKKQDSGSSEDGRVRRQWWASLDGRSLSVIGYSCAPDNPTSWWCPAVGYTLHEGTSLFATEVEAIDSLIAGTQHTIEGAEEQIKELRRRRSVL